jgi:FKBP-type peptidyl-prolyl cis-trans isomerase
VNYFRDTISPTRARALGALATLGALVLLTGCGGSSGGSSTLTIGNESKTDNSLITGTGTTSSTSSTSSTPTTASSGAATTPTSGPLSKEPKIPPGVGNTPPPNLVKVEVIKGSGAEAKQGSTVEVNYVGGLWKTGKEFDASWRRKEPFKFTIGGGEVIKGWEEAIVGMKVGGRRLIVVPPALGYGAKASGSIPANSTLTFVIDLLKVS